jgi:hypothetical protein
VGFKDVLRSKLGRHAQEVLTHQVIENACVIFQDEIKRKVCNPYENDYDTEPYLVRVMGAPEIPSIGLESGFLEFQKSCPPYPLTE